MSLTGPRTAMTESNESEDASTTRTTIEVDDAVWREVRSRAIREDKRVSEMLEAILRDHFDKTEQDDN